LGARQYESIHPKLESRRAKNGNPKSQQALERIEFARQFLAKIEQCLQDQRRRSRHEARLRRRRMSVPKIPFDRQMLAVSDARLRTRRN
jgi:hypothetical protein